METGEPESAERIDAPERDEVVKNSAAQARNDMRAVMGTMSGRAVLWRVIQMCGVHMPSFVNDVNQALWREGQRDIGRKVMGEIAAIDTNGEIRLLMEREAWSRAKSKPRR